MATCERAHTKLAELFSMSVNVYTLHRVESPVKEPRQRL